MSREIKFRAWDASSRQMCIWKLHKNPCVENDISYMWVSEEDSFVYPWEHPDLIKMQYIGRDDKNGVEIYEGDVLKVYFENQNLTMIGRVDFENGSYRVFGSDGNAPLISELHMLGMLPNKVEVIGNIYQHKNLLHEA